MASALPIAVIAWHFPYATDDPVRREDAIREFYEIAWAAGTPVMKDTEVARRAIPAYLAFDIPGHVKRFVDRYDLQDAAGWAPVPVADSTPTSPSTGSTIATR